MFIKVFLVFAICFLWLGNGQTAKKKRNGKNTEQIVKSGYPELFRDHVYRELSNKGKEMFYAANIHPECVAKKGQCIQRSQCTGREMLYISRVCYKWDLVCCYEKNIKFPEVAWKQYTPPAPLNITSEVYMELPVLP